MQCGKSCCAHMSQQMSQGDEFQGDGPQPRMCSSCMNKNRAAANHHERTA